MSDDRRERMVQTVANILWRNGLGPMTALQVNHEASRVVEGLLELPDSGKANPPTAEQRAIVNLALAYESAKVALVVAVCDQLDRRLAETTLLRHRAGRVRVRRTV